jgi:hypothetical protein
MGIGCAHDVGYSAHCIEDIREIRFGLLNKRLPVQWIREQIDQRVKSPVALCCILYRWCRGFDGYNLRTFSRGAFDRRPTQRGLSAAYQDNLAIQLAAHDGISMAV